MESNSSPSLWDSLISLGKELTSGTGTWGTRSRNNSTASNTDESPREPPPTVHFQSHSSPGMEEVNADTQEHEERQRVRQKELERRKSDNNLMLQEYVVKKGDTLNNLSLRFDMSVSQIKRINHLFNTGLIQGQTLKLRIPPTESEASGEADVLESKSIHSSKLNELRTPSSTSTIETSDRNSRRVEVARAILCLGDKRVHGELVITTYCVMFEPSESDPHVLQFGLMEYQFCVDVRDIKGCGGVSRVGRSDDDVSICEDNCIVAQSAKAGEPASDVDAQQGTAVGQSHQRATEKYLQVVWSSPFMNLREDRAILFLVNTEDCERLVEFIQLLLFSNASSNPNTQIPSPKSGSTLTSGKALLPGGALRIDRGSACGTSTKHETSRVIETVKSVSPSNPVDDSKTLVDSDEDDEITVVRVPQVLPSESSILSIQKLMEITMSLPRTLQSYNWRRLYGFDADGVALGTLYERVAGVKPTLLVIETTDGDIVGCFNSVAWDSSKAHSYYGTGEMFLFSFRQGKYCKYKWTGKNDFFISSGALHLGIGGGGAGFALMLDAELCHGSSNGSETFENQGPITSNEFFQVSNMEVFSFEFRQHDAQHENQASARMRTNSLSNLLTAAKEFEAINSPRIS